jgi:hypothetical protein
MVKALASYSGGPWIKSQAETGYPEGFCGIPQSPPGEFRDSALKNQAMSASFQILINSSFTYKPFIRRFLDWVTEKRH